MLHKIKLVIFLNLILISHLESHELNPARLILEEKENNSFDVVWKFPSNILTKPGSEGRLISSKNHLITIIFL